nr:MAG: hypothetical protein [Arizlama virus]
MSTLARTLHSSADIAESKLAEREGRGPHVFTEAEKDQLSRKRERSPPPPTQQIDDIMEEDDDDDCVVMNGDADGARRRLFESSSSVQQDDEEEAEQGMQTLASLAHAVPDLREYFLQFPSMDTKQVISMLRAYASYLATQVKKEPPKKKPRSGTRT